VEEELDPNIRKPHTEWVWPPTGDKPVKAVGEVKNTGQRAFASERDAVLWKAIDCEISARMYAQRGEKYRDMLRDIEMRKGKDRLE
jgi:hypothetical protein